MLCHVLMLILLLFLLLTCCADCGVSERPAAYPFLCYYLHGRLVVLAPFPALFRSPSSARLCTCLFMLRSKQSRAYMFRYCVSVAEADVRVRVRGRVVSVHVQRRQVRVVSVVAAAKTTNRRISAVALSFYERTQPHQLAATQIRLPHLAAGLDFCFVDVGPHLHTMLANCHLGFTRRKNRGHPTIGMTSVSDFSTRRPPCGGIFTPPFSRGRAVARVFVFGPRYARAVCVFFLGGVTRFARDGRLR